MKSPKQNAKAKPRPQSSPSFASATVAVETLADSPTQPPPAWRQTLRLILWAGVALIVCALLWVLWIRRMLVVFSGVAIVWACFALAAVFDHLWRRYNPSH